MKDNESVSLLTHEEVFKDKKPWKWYNWTWWWIRYGIWNRLIDLKWQIPNIICRAKRGWGHADVWGFYDYLTDVILGGLKYLKKINHGYPITVCDKNGKVNYDNIDYKANEKNWDEIMNKMIYTFEIAKDIAENDTMYRHSKEWTKEQYKKDLKFAEKMNIKLPEFPHKVLTKEECLAYEEGWKLFAEHFFSLAD